MNTRIYESASFSLMAFVCVQIFKNGQQTDKETVEKKK
jgi:hypothetical protein